MRIISQDGNKDFPYDRCTIWILDNQIIASPVGEPETDGVMGKYSTQEKAEKAMQMLHEAYTGVPFIVNNAEVPEDFAEQLKDLRSGFITIADHGDNVRVEPMNIVFRFPKENEL